jgi:hypothetical protein
MRQFNQKSQFLLRKILTSFLVVAFSVAQILPICPKKVYAQSALNLPAPGVMISPSAAFSPAIITGMTIHPENPLQFDFIVDTGDDHLEGENLKTELNKLINYFMATLTVPEDEMWVNLSPYEKNRIIADGLGKTEMGRDMLAQDYILKQLTASLLYPEGKIGQEFWQKVYAKAQEKFGTTEIPTDLFNKVWVIPQDATVYVNGNNVFVTHSYLKVMLEQDYLALESNEGNNNHGLGNVSKDNINIIGDSSAQIIREVLLPEIEKEINAGKSFSNLRQIYNSMILATWYKKKLRNGLLGKVYLDKNKTDGIELADKNIKEKIYGQYLEAFNKGVYNYIKEDYDEETQEIIVRKYFSGGIKFDGASVNDENDKGMLSQFYERMKKRSTISNSLIAVAAALAICSGGACSRQSTSKNQDVPKAESQIEKKSDLRTFELGQRYLHQDFLVERYKDVIGLGSYKVFPFYVSHSETSEFEVVEPALETVIEKAQKDNKKVAIFLERDHLEFDLIDADLVVAILRNSGNDKPSDEHLNDQLDKELKVIGTRFEESYLRDLQNLSPEAAREKLITILGESSFRFEAAQFNYLKGLLQKGIKVEVFFERRGKEHALQQILKVKEELKKQGVDIQSDSNIPRIKEIWLKHANEGARDNLPESIHLRDISLTRDINQYLGDNPDALVVTIRGSGHLSGLQELLQQSKVSSIPYVSAWDARESARKTVVYGFFDKSSEALNFKLPAKDAFSTEEINMMVAEEQDALDNIWKIISSNEKYVRTFFPSAEGAQATKDSAKDFFVQVAQEFLNSLVTSLGLSKEEARRVYYSTGGIRGVTYTSIVHVYNEMLVPTFSNSYLDILVREEFTEKFTDKYMLGEMYMTKTLAARLSELLITKGLSAGEDQQAWNQTIDQMVNDITQSGVLLKIDSSRIRKEIEEMSKRVISRVSSLLLISKENSDDLPQEPKQDAILPKEGSKKNSKQRRKMREEERTSRARQNQTKNGKDVGGIDLNSNNLNLKEQGQASEINFSLEHLQNIQNDNVNGIMPVIINITPVTNLPLLLGLSPDKKQEELSHL